MDKSEIPTDLDEAIQWLISNVKESDQLAIKSGKLDATQGHFGLGMWMRNNWGLWQGSELQDFFHNLGIRHADDMSGIILTSFQRELRGEDRKLDKQVKHYRTYWKNKGIDPDKIGIEEEE